VPVARGVKDDGEAGKEGECACLSAAVEPRFRPRVPWP
jgi:hypothetical protein